MIDCREIDCCAPDELANQGAVEIWQVADIGTGDANAEAVADLLNAQQASALIIAGDLDYLNPHDYETSVGDIFGEWKDRGSMFPVPGNHDWDLDDLTDYFDYFTELSGQRYYNKRFGPVEFFMVDSDAREPDGNTVGSVQYDLMASKIERSDASWKILICHHAPYSSDAVHGDTVEMQWDYADLGIDLVISGHGHTYEHILLDGVHYIVNGLGGGAIYGFTTPVEGSVKRYNAKRGALRVRASIGELNLAFFNIYGVLIEMVKLKA